MTRMTARSLIFLPSILLPALAFAQQTPQSLADAELPSLLTIYKDIHAHPELSMHEEWRWPDCVGAHRSGCAASARRDRFALREHLHDKERRRKRSSRDARVRARRAYFHVHWSGTSSREIERSMARHHRVRSAAGGRDR